MTAVTFVIRFSDLNSYLDQNRLQIWVESFGAFGPLVYILIFAIAPALFLPGLPITLAGGLAFGPIWGTVYASVGSTIGAGLAFLISRYFAREGVEKFIGEQWKKIDEGVTQRGWIYVAITRLIPSFPFNFLNYAFGLTKIPFGTYIITSWVCMFPATAAYVIFASSLLTLLQEKILNIFLIGLVLLLLVYLIPLAYRKWRGVIVAILIGCIGLTTPFTHASDGTIQLRIYVTFKFDPSNLASPSDSNIFLNGFGFQKPKHNGSQNKHRQAQ